ncbi:hypothetical protein HYZ70_03065 [Candidatus Curtissbacteria bacterium]|nr:hypothetical protein [Candidatus Curtissbacteria bacterium]
MSDLSFSVQKITGQPSAISQCAVFTKRITLSSLDVGTLASCILARGEGRDLGEVMRGIFEIAERKLEGTEEGILAALEGTIEPTENYSHDVDLDLVHAFFYQNVCYIVRLGQKVKVFLFDSPKSGELNFKSGSGPISPGQLYLIATDAFFSIFDTSPLSGEAEVDLEEVIDGIATEIAGEENQSEVGAAFIAVRGVAEEEGTVAGGALRSEASEASEASEPRGNGREEPKESKEPEREAAGEEMDRETVDIKDIEGLEDREEGQKESEEENSESVSWDQIGVNQLVSESVDQKTSVPENQKMGITESLKMGITDTLIRRIAVLPKRILAAFFAELSKIRRGDIGALRKQIVLVAIVVVLVLLVSVGFAVYEKGESDKMAKFNQHLEVASAKYSEAVAILEQNRRRAREILVEAESEIKLAREIREDERSRKLAEDIAAKLKETEISSDAAFNEVASLGDSLKSLGISGNTLFAISGDKLYGVNMATGDVLEESSGGGVFAGAIFGRAAFVIADGKIRRVDIGEGKSIDVGVREGGLDIGIFAGNVYVLSQNSIRKFVPIESGYSQGIEYLSSPQSFSSRSHFSIDGAIWVTEGSNIAKFLRGEKQDFAISGLTGAGEFSLIYTTASLDNLYVVDFVNSALLVIGKDGLYKKVLQSSEFSRASDLAVDEAEEKLYITSGARILAASLK